jgi:hypothetical protein
VCNSSTAARSLIKRVCRSSSNADPWLTRPLFRIPPNHSSCRHGLCRFGCSWLLC